MRLSQAFAVRDQMNKQELFRVFGDDPDTVSKIQTAFVNGESKWDAELDLLLGPFEAKRLRDVLPKDITL